jgi:soluble cytochrome b562
MKLSTAAAVLATLSSAHAFVLKPRPSPLATTVTSSSLGMSTTEETDAAAPTAAPKSSTKKEDRLRFMKSEHFYRKGFKEVREDVEKTMQEQFKGKLIDDLKASNYVIERDGVKVYLAKVRPIQNDNIYITRTNLLYKCLTQCTVLHKHVYIGLWFLLGCGEKYCFGL